MRALLQRWFPRLAAKVEAESRSWLLTCPDCGHTRSVWDAGGVRYRARGKQRERGRCAGCGKVVALKLHREGDTT